MARDQRRGRERDTTTRAGHAEPNRDNEEARGFASSTQRVAGVTQRVPEVALHFKSAKEIWEKIILNYEGDE